MTPAKRYRRHCAQPRPTAPHTMWGHRYIPPINYEESRTSRARQSSEYPLLETPSDQCLETRMRHCTTSLWRVLPHREWGLYEVGVCGPDGLLVRIGWPSRLMKGNGPDTSPGAATTASRLLLMTLGAWYTAQALAHD